MSGAIRALVAPGPGRSATFTTIDEGDLGEGDVLVDVGMSSLNYKDGLAVTGSAPIARTYPMVCGIDLAGTVLSSGDDRFAPGDLVAVAGHGLCETHHGGYATRARVPASWCVALGGPLDSRRAMAIGTAGVTAMLAVLALERNGSTPDELARNGDLPVLVTGAAGGVGSLAVVLLAHLGYRVLASTGRPEEEAYLRHLGAAEVAGRELLDVPAKALDRERFGAVVDVVGSAPLARAIASTRAFGTVAVCGLAGGADLDTTVHPLILRGVTIAGINSVLLPSVLQDEVWHRLARDVPFDLLDELTVLAGLDDVPGLAPEILAGRVRGRVVVQVP